MAGSLISSLQLTINAAIGCREATRIASENIIGSKDPAYVKRTSSQSVQVLRGGQITGISIDAPLRVIDTQILEELRVQTTRTMYDSTVAEYMVPLDDLSGSLSGSGTLDTYLQTFTQKAHRLALEPNSGILKRDTINSLEDFTKGLRDFGSGIEKYRRDIDRNIVSTVDSINFFLTQISDFNLQIASAAHMDQDYTMLESKRDQAVRDLSQVMDVLVVDSQTNKYIYTSGGVPLIENKIFPMSYSSSGYISYSAIYPDSIPPVTVENSVNPTVKDSVTTQIKGGKMGALLYLRDTRLVDVQKSVDELSKHFYTEINRLHNLGSGFPPAKTLSGTLSISDADISTPIAWKNGATVRLALTDNKGFLVQNLDLELCSADGSTSLSSTDIQDTINNALGSGVASFSGGNSGTLTLTAPTDMRIAIGNISGSVNGETTDGVGFSEYFHLNDLITVSPDSQGRGYANTIAVRSQILKDPSLFSMAKLNASTSASSTAATVSDKIGIASGDASTLLDIRAKILDPTVSFSEAGIMNQQINSLSGYVQSFIGTVGDLAARAMQNKETSDILQDGMDYRFSMFSGINTDDEMADIFTQKILYQGILNSTRNIMEMLTQFIRLLEQI